MIFSVCFILCVRQFSIEVRPRLTKIDYICYQRYYGYLEKDKKRPNIVDGRQHGIIKLTNPTPFFQSERRYYA